MESKQTEEESKTDELWHKIFSDDFLRINHKILNHIDLNKKDQECLESFDKTRLLELLRKSLLVSQNMNNFIISNEY